MVWIRNNPLTALFIAVLAVAAVLLSIQLPFLYYSDDIVFHAAKVMDARYGDFYTDPVTGFETVYPPLYHIIVGTAARLFGLDSFQTSRAVQVVQFVGLFLGALFLFGQVLPKREQAAFAGLALVLLMYAPTGRYWLLGNPFNFSVMFVLTGAALTMLWYRRGGLIPGLAGVGLLGIGTDIWWWNLFPAAAVAAGLLWALVREHRLRSTLPQIVGLTVLMVIVLAYNLWPLYQVRDILPNYRTYAADTSHFAEHGWWGTLTAWVIDFLLKGNAQFFKYLFPEALSSNSRLVIVHGLVASIYYYLLVLPVNLGLVVAAIRGTGRAVRAKLADGRLVLIVAAAATMLFSLVTLFQTNASVTRRVQLYTFIFLLPMAVWFLYEKFALDRRTKLRRVLAVIFAGALIYSVIYRFNVTLTNPTTPATEEVAAFIDGLPDHADTRIFVSEYDNHRLLRVARYRSFELRGNPTYFRQDKPQADSIAAAYDAIVAGGPSAEQALREFDTRYAVVGKISAAISPVMTQKVENKLSQRLQAYFDRNAEPVLSNSEWVVYRLEYPFAADSGAVSPKPDETDQAADRITEDRNEQGDTR